MLKSGEMYDASLDAADTQRRRAQKLESARKIVDSQSSRVAQKSSENTDKSDDTATSPSTKSVAELKNAEGGADEPAAPKKRGRPRKKAADIKPNEDGSV